MVTMGFISFNMANSHSDSLTYLLLRVSVEDGGEEEGKSFQTMAAVWGTGWFRLIGRGNTGWVDPLSTGEPRSIFVVLVGGSGRPLPPPFFVTVGVKHEQIDEVLHGRIGRCTGLFS